MSNGDGFMLNEEQAAAVDELVSVLTAFALAIEECRKSGLSVVTAFRCAGIEIPAFVPDAVLEGLFASAE